MYRRSISLFFLVMLAAPVRADFAEVPLDVLVDEADLIVTGKVLKILEASFFTIGPKKSDHAVYYDVAALEVGSILKAPPTFVKPKQLQIGQPGKNKITSADIRFRPGQEGIWLLTQDPGRNVFFPQPGGVWAKEPNRRLYWAKHPSQHQDEKETKKIADLVEARAKLPAGKEANGLVARAEVLETQGGFKVRLSLKNVSDKPLTVCDYVGNRPLKANWIGPDGTTLQSKHYAWLAAADLASLSERDFAVIQPGGVHFLPRGIDFRPPTEKRVLGVNVAQAGQHKVTISFTNNEDGKQFGLENVWTGTTTANEVTFTVK